MALNDVWRTIGAEVGFYYEVTFEDVPSSPGVYAWFYPLRVLSRSRDSIQQLVTSVQALLNYDAGMKGPPHVEATLAFSWWSLALNVGRIPKAPELSNLLDKSWADIAASDDFFADLQLSLLKASIFMPPLYVGKADNLNTRCSQHLRERGGPNTFHDRFEAQARHLGLHIRSVRELVFACVRTGPPPVEGAGAAAPPVHELIEGIMKSICAPPYGVR